MSKKTITTTFLPVAQNTRRTWPLDMPVHTAHTASGLLRSPSPPIFPPREANVSKICSRAVVTLSYPNGRKPARDVWDVMISECGGECKGSACYDRRGNSDSNTSGTSRTYVELAVLADVFHVGLDVLVHRRLLAVQRRPVLDLVLLYGWTERQR